MAHSRTKPAGWAVNEKLTSAQINDIDIKTSESLDKTAAGDNVEGSVTWDSGAEIIMDAGSVFDSSGDTVFRNLVQVTGASAKISTASSGRIEHGDNDYPLLAAGHAGRTLTRYHTLGSLTKFGSAAAGAAGDTLTAGSTSGFALPVHHGATLTSVSLRFIPDTVHVGLPAANIQMLVQRRSNLLGGTQSVDSLLSTGSVSYTPVSLADYNLGVIKQLLLTCNQNHSIDRTAYTYEIFFTNENGANALSTAFVSVVLVFAITDLRIG